MKAALVYPLVLLLFWSCSPVHQEAVPNAVRPTLSADAALDTAQAYRNAIASYIKAVSKNGDALPDTLYIGRHMDLPNIELPAVIEHVNIRSLTEEEAERVKDLDGFVYLNMFGWFAGGSAEFLVVTFRHGFRPQHNCHLYFIHSGASATFELDSLGFEYPYQKSE
ncbi:MAG: hypothetical protein IPO90_01585 [Flavobacteriales bacterium]|nr:hypothetical protein [Flavobacteriales bacterium]MBL0045107.1 hypothetical protein [Flavobacteriales bacterium]